jgi:hypothetical protein
MAPSVGCAEKNPAEVTALKTGTQVQRRATRLRKGARLELCCAGLPGMASFPYLRASAHSLLIISRVAFSESRIRILANRSSSKHSAPLRRWKAERLAHAYPNSYCRRQTTCRPQLATWLQRCVQPHQGLIAQSGGGLRSATTQPEKKQPDSRLATRSPGPAVSQTHPTPIIW